MALKYYAVKKGKTPGIYMTWAECEANVKGFPGAEYKSFSSRQDADTYLSDKVIEPVSDAKDETVHLVLPTKETMKTADEYEALKVEAKSHLQFLKDNGFVSPKLYQTISSQIDANVRLMQGYQDQMESRDWSPYPDHANIFVDGSYNAETNEYGYGVYYDDGVKQQILSGRGVCQDGGRNVEGEVEAARQAIAFASANPHCKSITVYHDYQGIGSWADKAWQANKGYTKDYANFVNKQRESGLKIDFVHVDGHTGVEGNEYVDKIAKIACDVPLTNKEWQFISKLEDIPGYPKIRELPEIDGITNSENTIDYSPK